MIQTGTKLIQQTPNEHLKGSLIKITVAFHFLSHSPKLFNPGHYCQIYIMPMINTDTTF